VEAKHRGRWPSLLRRDLDQPPSVAWPADSTATRNPRADLRQQIDVERRELTISRSAAKLEPPGRGDSVRSHKPRRHDRSFAVSRSAWRNLQRDRTKPGFTSPTAVSASTAGRSHRAPGALSALIMVSLRRRFPLRPIWLCLSSGRTSSIRLRPIPLVLPRLSDLESYRVGAIAAGGRGAAKAQVLLPSMSPAMSADRKGRWATGVFFWEAGSQSVNRRTVSAPEPRAPSARQVADEVRSKGMGGTPHRTELSVPGTKRCRPPPRFHEDPCADTGRSRMQAALFPFRLARSNHRAE